VDANSGSRVMSLLKDAPKTIERLTVTGGDADVGGGILVASAQEDFETRKHTLRNLLILENSATVNGGGIHTGSHPLKISRTRIVGNFAVSGGGGVYMGSTPTAALGDPPLSISATTVNNNQAGLGAGLYLDGADPGGAPHDPRADIVNSTFAYNVATVSGGGLASILGADLNAEHTTVAYNTADADNVGGGAGGGIYQSSDADFDIENALVKENTVGTSGAGPQCAGEFLFDGVITPQGTPGLCVFLGGSLIQPETEPRIGGLADNGGPTPTIEIQVDSLANGWNESFCPATDQRGVSRPANDCDAGAYERP
jgi:predicted outer membrane repeat protein